MSNLERLLLLSEALLVWSLATATSRADLRWTGWRSGAGLTGCFGPAARSLAAAVLVATAAWEVSAWNLLLALVVAATSSASFGLRSHMTDRGRLAELEIFGVLALAVAAAPIIWWGDLEVKFPFLRLPLTPEHLLLASITSLGFVLGVFQAGNVVQGVLQKGHIRRARDGGGRPEGGTAKLQLRHGRLIGYLERIILILLVIKGSYEGLGFLIAAKGLIRAEELKTREVAEYFLVGTLASVVCALAVGIALEYAFRLLW